MLDEKQNFQFAVGKENLIHILIGVGLVALGFILMSGGGSDDPALYSEKIFSFRRITLAPVICMAGFLWILVAIMKKPRHE
ncbi:MAG: DUF3098 domain-containing protein [Bacteroidales bacterium]|jgi:hypothetical protein|nr:DUF3098 domain-containing protein [Bacteroidales bacterium]